MTKILILGAKGMLGQELVRIFGLDTAYEVTAWDIEDVDVTNHDELQSKINDLWPDIVCNAIAYNAVDACEENEVEYQNAIMLNVRFPQKLAQICNALQATCVHYSTDYVFDGERPVYHDATHAPSCCGRACRGCMYRGDLSTIEHFVYSEDDMPRPLSRYGQSKYDGERIVAKEAGNHYIVRLSKLFGKPAASSSGKKSFFDVMLVKGRESEQSGDIVKVVNGELSKFTYAPDLAVESKAIIEEGADYGIYHVVNDGACTWYEGVLELYQQKGIEANLELVTPESFPRPAARPSCSVLGVTKRDPLRHYEDALKEYLNTIE